MRWLRWQHSNFLHRVGNIAAGIVLVALILMYLGGRFRFIFRMFH